MKLNHVNLTVTDVPAASDFLEKYFGLKKLDTSADARGDNFGVLFDDNGLVFTLMKGAEVQYPKTFHIGFIQESEEKVNEINQRLKEDGYKVAPPVRSHGWTFYVKAPGGFTVEVLA
ncbi:VOC family protein [Brevibacillus sp. HB1.2]|uniref:VOC family protein n=1 Tax=Brevibacillus porteri TaxID=2126350 RepID=A0ABX5FSV5_9BACL|nr:MULTISPECIES: VOC family protein [Brevibacillus]ATF13287.1 VOC family protein [Brevibacillus brevis X23]MDC0759553.1 VOC family protein [Brevibacillus sp. AG]MED1799230.1 VOC family protein [Brevibacillus porteri]MED2132382.1 VOC family protein [Brevibacillus porteri]MED2744466.1 VOC family protein [Brevibacillus porteri]